MATVYLTHDLRHDRRVAVKVLRPEVTTAIGAERFLRESGHAVVSDFGIARAIEAAATDRLTGSGVVVGTPGYMSPEQSTEGAPVDGRSDMYSLACVVYEMLGGDLPFQGFSPHAILARQALEP